MKSKRKLELAERDISLLEKTLVNQYINLKSKIEGEDTSLALYQHLLETEEVIVDLIPEGKQYLEKGEFWPTTIDDFDTPIDFNE